MIIIFLPIFSPLKLKLLNNSLFATLWNFVDKRETSHEVRSGTRPTCLSEQKPFCDDADRIKRENVLFDLSPSSVERDGPTEVQKHKGLLLTFFLEQDGFRLFIMPD